MQREAAISDLGLGRSVLASDWQATRRKLFDYLMYGVVVGCAALGVFVLVGAGGFEPPAPRL